MRLESLERDTLEERLKREKEQAEEELYSQLDNKSVFKTQNKEQKAIKQEVTEDELEDIVTTKSEAKKKQESADIFNSENISYADEEEVPTEKLPPKEEKAVVVSEPRKASSVKVKFTEKLYPHLAAREQHLKEPPLPKTTQIQKTGKVNYKRKKKSNLIG